MRTGGRGEGLVTYLPTLLRAMALRGHDLNELSLARRNYFTHHILYDVDCGPGATLSHPTTPP
jgi:hypothetical protein